jgi:hypothetical protein
MYIQPKFDYFCVQVSVLKQHEAPEIWVAAGEGCSFLEKFSYVLSELPSKGELFSEQDGWVIQVTAKAT